MEYNNNPTVIIKNTQNNVSNQKPPDKKSTKNIFSPSVTPITSAFKKKITTSTMKTPKKNNSNIPLPKSKNFQNKHQYYLLHQKSNVYSKNLIKKNYESCSNLNKINKSNGRSMSQFSLDYETQNQQIINLSNKNQKYITDTEDDKSNHNIKKKQTQTQIQINSIHDISNFKKNDENNKNALNSNTAFYTNISNYTNFTNHNNNFHNYHDDEENNLTYNTSTYESSNNISIKHKPLLKFDNKMKKGYYSENDNKKEKNVILNIEEILMIEEKLYTIIKCIQKNSTCAEECFEFFNTFFNTEFSLNFEKYFIIDDYIKIVKRAVNINIFSIMLCYYVSFDENIFFICRLKLNEIMTMNHMILILISKYLLNKILDNNFWVIKLSQLISKYDPIPKNTIHIFKDIIFYCNILIKIIPIILQQIPNINNIFQKIFSKLDDYNSAELFHIYRENIHRNLNQNGSIFASSSYFMNNSDNTNCNIPVPFIHFKQTKNYTLVLDLDETLIHFKMNPNDEESGTIQIRPYLYNFLDKIKNYYELVVFTAATQEYADPIIDAIEQNKKYFDYRLYRIHTIIIDNDFVKDLSKLGRDLSKVIIVDNMKQNYKLQKNNGINIRPFWGKDDDDTALIDLLDILIKIAEKNLDVRVGLKIFKEDIINKVTSNIFRRTQL